MKDLKDDVSEALILHLQPLQAEILGYLKNSDVLEAIVADGTARGAAVAEKKIKEVKEKMGLVLAK